MKPGFRQSPACGAVSSGIIPVDDVTLLDADIYGANIQHSQLDRGSFEAQLVRVTLESAVFDAGFFRQRICGFGTMPREAYSFVLVSGKPGEGHLNGAALSKKLWLYQPGQEIWGTLPPEAHWYTASFSKARLEQRLQTLGMDIDTLRRIGASAELNHTRVDQLNKLAGATLRSGAAAGTFGDAAQLEERLLFACCDSIVSEQTPEPDIGESVGAVRHAEEFMRANLERQITMFELCRQLSCSRRYIEYAFKRYCGVGPITYHRRLRLSAARRQLLLSERDTGLVTKIATRFGFCHMGNFAAEYKATFGEAPSATCK